MIVGLYNRSGDLDINVCLGVSSSQTCVSSSSDGTIQNAPFTDLSLEQCIDFIEDDELLEVTPHRASAFVSVSLNQINVSAQTSKLIILLSVLAIAPLWNYTIR